MERSDNWAGAQNDVDPIEFRNTLGRFATGITVVTTVTEGEIHGMTANAFMSVSLHPPLVAVAVDRKAHLHALLRVGSRYGVSILSSEQEAYSSHFAGFGAQDLEPDFVWVDDVPLIRGAIAHLTTEVVDAHPAGDHTLFIGRVRTLESLPGEPVLYFRGQYGDFKGRS